MRDENNQSKGFGFVCFKHSNDAKKALQENAVNGLYVAEAKTKEQRLIELQKKALGFKKSTMYLNLFVKGYNKATTTEEDLKAFFARFGEVRSVSMKDQGYAFVYFQEREGARMAKEGASNMNFNGSYLTVDFF